MWDSQKKQKINKSAQILGQSGAVQFNNIEKRLPGRIHRFQVLSRYCSFDRAGTLRESDLCFYLNFCSCDLHRWMVAYSSFGC